MYHPPQFRSDDPAIAAEIMRAHPLASLISLDDEGFPFVTHLPLHVRTGGTADSAGVGAGAGRFLLLGHCARANPQWHHLLQRPRAAVTFLGPQAYLSPAVYADRERVPTWNYLAVHCTVQVTLVEAAHDKDRLLKCLIGDHEPAYADQWRGLRAEYTDKMLAGIVGLELAVTDWQCKIKINQHRPEAVAAMQARYAQGNEQEQALARWLGRITEEKGKAP